MRGRQQGTSAPAHFPPQSAPPPRAPGTRPPRRIPRPRSAVLAFVAALIALALALPAVASAAEFSLTVTLAGTGGGEVECEVEGVSEPCGGTTIKYLAGTELTLSVEAELGSEFVGWTSSGSAACTGTENPCTFTITENSSVTATFNLEPPPEVALTVKKAGNGSGTVECEIAGGLAKPCEGTTKYPEGTELTLIAKAEPGSEFSHWSGACELFGEVAECLLTMEEGPLSVTATFNLQPALTIHTSGTGSGTVTCEAEAGEEECAKRYPKGTVLILRAKAGPDSEFVKWSGECERIVGNECEVEMEKARSVTATFNRIPRQLSVTKNGTGKGSVSSKPGGISCGTTCSASFGQGTTVTLTGVPGANTQAVQWSGCDSVDGEGRCVVAMNAARAVTATFNAKPPETCETNPALCPKGKAKASPTASVKSGKALLRLTCSGGPCKGTLKLTARIGKGTKKNVVIGRASFNLAAGASKTIKVKLSGAARRELAKHGKLKAKVSGTGIQSRTVKLKPAKKR